MDEGTSEVIATLGTMQTLVDNFPMGIISQIQAANPKSIIEFLTDCLGTINVTEKDIFKFILTDILGVNFSMDEESLCKMNKWLENLEDEDFANCEFLNAIEDFVKWLINLFLSELLSCSIHPRIQSEFVNRGVICPIDAVDLNNMFDICPTSDEGRRNYDNVPEGAVPSQLSNAKDLNAFLWYVLYKAPGAAT